MKIVNYLIGLLLLTGCSKNLDNVFTNKKVESLFISFCNEVKKSDLKKSDNIFIYTDESCKYGNCNITFINCLTLNDTDMYAKFHYNGLVVYVDKNISKDVLILDNYSNKLPTFDDENNGPGEFIEMWLAVKKDTVRFRKLNFKGENSNKWMTK
ncbi:hypothetical protein [Chryseobacterium flavum]|uniref:hypothetical protein n=1 Tax=Chryseobacterium flavum TaxID=415851 RepID=UPI0028B159D0|nr:hypothetical protein [Chryseobacterium flavum]